MADFVAPPDVSLNGLNTSRAISNKWIGYIPLQNSLGNNFRNLELDLVRFTIPQINLGTSQTTFKGISYELPNHTLNPSDKEITFEYKINEDWYNYKALFVWASAFAILNPVDADALKAQTMGQNVIAATGVSEAAAGTGMFTDLLNCRVWLLNNYKQRLIDFTFYNCFIKNFADLALDYSSTDEIAHSFTLAYTHFTIDKVGLSQNEHA